MVKSIQRFFILYSVLLFAYQIVVYAQKENLVIEQLSVEQGLSFNAVTNIIQDKRGFMWFATADGLNRFDGYTFITYKPNPNDTNSLTNAFVNSLYTDSYGIVWANIVGYLHRINEINGSSTRLLQGMWLTSMCEDTSRPSDPGMWFTTYGNGLHWWSRKKNKFIHYLHDPKNLDSISSDSLLCVSVDRNGTLWVGTSRGLNSIDAFKKNVDRHSKGPNIQVFDICIDPSSNSEFIWMATEKGLYMYDSKSNNFYLYKNPFADPNQPNENDVRTLFFDSKGTLWVGMVGGIGGFDIKTKKYFTFFNQVQSYPWAHITKTWLIQEDPIGTVWALAHGAGHSSNPLLKFDNKLKKFITYPTRPEGPLYAYSMYIDRLGIMWLGTVDQGVLKVDKYAKPFHNYLYDSEKRNAMTIISGITEDNSGSIWLGSNNGLYKFAPYTESFTLYQHDPKNPVSLSSNVIGPVTSDHSGNIWIGNNGVDLYEPQKNIFHHYENDQEDTNSLSGEDVNSLLISHDGTVWIGVSNGILDEYLPASRSFKHHSPDYTGAFDHIIMLGLVEDEDGMIWYILRGAGLISFDREKKIFKRYSDSPKPYSPPTSLATIGLSALYADNNGNLWIGSDAGVIHYAINSKEFSVITEQDGLANQNVRSILEDDEGYIWFGTTKGISKYSPETKKLWNFDESDGLKFGQVIRTTGCKTKSGEMYIGGSNGFIRFHPDSIRLNPNVPPIWITEFKKFGRRVILDSVITEKKQIELSYKDNVISFDFVALNYSSTKKNQYAYKLDGFDKEWIFCGTKRSATYTNLDAGTYIFRVKGSNNDGVWNEHGTSLRIIITPPFWETSWFRILALVLLFVSIGGSVRFVEMRKVKRKIEKLEQERALERERERISQDMHDEVGSSLSEIAILSELAKKNPEESEYHIQEISERAAEVIDSVSEIVWAMNPQNDKIDNLIAHARRYAVKYLNLSSIECKFISPEIIPSYPLSAELRRNIFLVVKEVLHNIVKHSCANQVLFIIDLSDKLLNIKIEDNGKGFSVDVSSGLGNGLINMRKRIEDIGGRIQIDTSPGKGTKVSFSMNIT